MNVSPDHDRTNLAHFAFAQLAALNVGWTYTGDFELLFPYKHVKELPGRRF